MNWFKKKITKEQAEAEINELKDIYKKRYPSGNSGFLVGTSLGRTKHKFGDSGRYWELREILDN